MDPLIIISTWEVACGNFGARSILERNNFIRSFVSDHYLKLATISKNQVFWVYRNLCRTQSININLRSRKVSLIACSYFAYLRILFNIFSVLRLASLTTILYMVGVRTHGPLPPQEGQDIISR